MPELIEANQPATGTSPPRRSPADRPSRRQRVVTAEWMAEATRERAAPPGRTSPIARAAETTSRVRVLIVARETVPTSPLIEAVQARAARGSCAFTLLVPSSAHGLHRLVDPEDQDADEAQSVLDTTLPLLEQAAGAPVVGLVGDPTALSAVEDAVNAHGFDEIIVYTRPARLTRWLKLDLPSKVTGLGLPTTTVTP